MRKFKDAKYYYGKHKESARQRSISFYFTFEEWVRWWGKHLGRDWLKMRGPRSGQYVMARKLDKGPYAWWNVRCITSNQNHSDTAKNGTSTRGSKNPMAKIDESIARELYNSTVEQETTLTVKYGLTFRYIKRIKQGKVWGHATKGLSVAQINFEGRHPKGEAHPNSKLNVELVREIYFSKEPPSIIALRFGISKGKVRGIRGRREWKSTTEAWGPAPAMASRRGQRVDILYRKGLL
jgi:hypothetical protein